MIPVVQIILALAGVIFGGKLTGLLGLSAPSGDTGTEGRVYVMSDHPAAQGTATSPAAPAAPSSPASPAPAPSAPPVKQIVADTVRQPWSVWGIAALCLTAPLLIAQVRAGAHEAAGGARSVYDEGRSAYRRVDNADDYTANRSRRNRRR